MERRKYLPTALGWLALLLMAVCFAVFPLLSLFQQNQSEVQLAVLWRPLAASVVAAVVVFGLFAFVVRSVAKAALLASLALVAFFYYGIFAGQFGLRDRWFLPLWLVLFALGLVALLLTRRELNAVALVVGVAAVVLVAGPSPASPSTRRAIRWSRPHTPASGRTAWPRPPPTRRSATFTSSSRTTTRGRTFSGGAFTMRTRASSVS